MIKIAEVVKEIIRGDQIAFEAHKSGVLNLSAYAEKIKPLIEKKLIKSVRKGSIVVALSRISKGLGSLDDLRPNVVIDDISVKSPLCEMTFEKTENAQQSAASLLKKMELGSNFFTITEGINEITIIYSKNQENKIKNAFRIKPKGEYADLVGITVKFDEKEYIEVPNMIFSLVSALATKRINLIEIVSTFSEISFIVRKRDMHETIEALRLFFK